MIKTFLIWSIKQSNRSCQKHKDKFCFRHHGHGIQKGQALKRFGGSRKYDAPKTKIITKQ